MDRWRAVVPIVLALVVAVVASVLIYKWMKKQTAPKEVAKIEEVRLKEAATAEVNLPVGTQLKAEMIKSVSFLEDSLPPGSFSDPNELVGRVVIAPLERQELILESRLAPKDVKRGGMAAILKPGKRAISIAGNKNLGVSGLVNPGDRVDILLTTTAGKGKINKTIFENVLILATGAQLSKNPEGKTSPVDSYTLEVTPEQAEKVILATSEGKIHFALRSVLDRQTVLTTGATSQEILASYRPVKPSERVKPKKVLKEGRPTAVQGAGVARKGFTLEVIKGLNRQTRKF
jgi:pilus assembly protein CpaB